MPGSFFKRFSFLAAIVLSTTSAIAQTEYLVTVDPSNAEIIKIDSIPGVAGFFGGYIPAFSEYNSHFSFIGAGQFGGPYYLYTVDVLTGQIISSPLMSSNNSYLAHFNFQYGKYSNLLFSTVRVTPQSPPSLAIVDPLTGNYTVVATYPNLSTIVKLIPDEINDRMFIFGSQTGSGGLALLTVNIHTGIVLAQVTTNNLVNLQYDYIRGKFYGLSIGQSPTMPYQPYSFCKFDPITGTKTNLLDLTNAVNIFWGNETLDENAGRYFVSAYELGDTTSYLYTIDINTGNLLHKVAVPQRNVIDKDNLVQFRYDNRLSQLFALFWEAHTLAPTIPPLPNVNIDSSCQIFPGTKIYSIPSSHKLIVDKKVTICQVSFTLHNMMGQLVVKSRMIRNGYNEIDLSGLAYGIYAYRFISGNRTISSGKILNQ